MNVQEHYIRRGSKEMLEKLNPILHHAELVCEYATHDKEAKYKQGDGKTPWSELPYIESIPDHFVLYVGDVPKTRIQIRFKI